MNLESLMACFCKSREALHFYSNCLSNNNLSDEDKELLYELVQDAASASNRIKKHCEDMVKK